MMSYQQWKKMDDEQTAKSISEGKTTPYDLAVGRLFANLAFFRNHDFIVGEHVATGLEKEHELFAESIGRLARRAPNDPMAMKICACAISTLSKQGQLIPTPLADLAREVMQGRIRVGAQRGRPKTSTRDAYIVEVISEISYWFPEMPITRNEATETESVCAVVAQALKDPRLSDFKVTLSEKSIERAWSHRMKRVPS